MATAPHLFEENSESDIDLNAIDWAGAKLPGYTIDEFLERGDQEGARKEFARLIQEGIDSGPGREITMEEMINNVRARVAKDRI